MRLARRPSVATVTVLLSLSAAGLAALAWKKWHADAIGGIASAVSLSAAVAAAWVQWASYRIAQPPGHQVDCPRFGGYMARRSARDAWRSC